MTACLLLGMSLPNLGNAMRAATADGVKGKFTAGELSCIRHPGHETCEWIGSFRSADGMLVRESIRLYGSGRDSLEVGQEIAALDIGSPGRVYSSGTSREWVFTGILLLGGYGILALLAKRHLMPPPRTAPRSGPATA
ncbi:hypothetical protein [Streptomyces cahuitamycinicus]|uniref:Uncharacterized protein n=1 Tax=Streptomyces cahuitamycinicus TaxID=2070367 RepID=A0A2N8TX05_9ACTN|nr:hypothetical protein [Streptomyces cahuitamycinicus]PNG23541.1 hypothetical protein C1J00_03465 [Streptomyces cahuitamycinicus]